MPLNIETLTAFLNTRLEWCNSMNTSLSTRIGEWYYHQAFGATELFARLAYESGNHDLEREVLALWHSYDEKFEKAIRKVGE